MLYNRVEGCGYPPLACSVEHGLELVVEDEDESSTGSSEDVGKATLEESSWSLVLEDLLEAVHGSIVHGISSLLSSVHHESSSHGIKWVRGDTGTDSDDLGESPLVENVGLLEIVEENDLSGIEGTEVRGSVHDDTNDGDTETIVETTDSTLLSGLLKAINESSELSSSSGTDISGESGSSEIEWVDEAEGSGTSSTTGGAVTNEEHAWLGLWVVWAEVDLVEILACEVDGLGWEITNHVGEVTSVKGSETLLRDDSLEAITNTVISVLWEDVLVSILNLEEELNSLNWGDDCLGDSSGNTTNQEIDNE